MSGSGHRTRTPFELCNPVGKALGEDRLSPYGVFMRECSLEVASESVVDAAPVVDEARPRERGELLRPFDRRVERAAVAHDAVHESDALCLLGAELASGENQIEGSPQPDDLRQTVGATVD